jgi:hypothetical protein
MSTATADQTDRIQRTLAVIREDIRADVERREGQPFDGRHVAAALGEICAQIDALAGILQVMVGESA